tara:strand:+ start:266 stop:580 length:315 start_codon:yes stop_codon:yes gene_type:complete
MCFLSGCAETFALLGTATTVVQGGNVAQSTVTSAVNYGIKKSTGKTSLQHAVDFAEKNNPKNEKKRCINFIEKTNSEVCAVVKNSLANVKTNIKTRSKIKNLEQ